MKKTDDTLEPMAFTFGDDVEVLDKREIFDYLTCNKNSKWYDTPVNFHEVTKLLRAAVHHESALIVKRNILVSTFIPNKFMSTSLFTRLAWDFLVLGNAYPVVKRARAQNILSLDYLPAKYTKRGLKDGQYWYVPKYDEEIEFKSNVYHLMEADINQEIYGLPSYLSSLNSVLLNESATLFRRRYYKNGSHAGYILYLTDPAQNQADVDSLRKALKDSKGPGNFKNLFMYAPNGKKDGLQVIPVADAAAKDEFLGIKNASRDDILAAHRVPPQLMGIIPNNTGGFGDVEKAAKVFAINEIEPIQSRLKEINEWLGEDVIQFSEYKLTQLNTPA